MPRYYKEPDAVRGLQLSHLLADRQPSGARETDDDQYLLQEHTKHGPQQTVHEQPFQGLLHMALAQESRNQWRPGSCKTIPWMGLLGLILALVCALGIIVVLVSANGKPTDSWPSEQTPIQISVVLAIIIAVGNTGITLAYQEGVTLTWWVKMLKGGNLNDCHRYWQHGSSAFQSILGIKHFNKISFASVLLLLLVVDNPLVQRAASFVSVAETTPARFKAALSTGQLNQPTAYYMTHAPGINTLSGNFSRVVADYTNRNAITIDLEGCSGTCSGSLVAAGFDISCRRDYTNYDLDLKAGGNATVGSISVSSDGIHAPGIITVLTTHKATDAETGKLINTNCTLHSAQVKYPFTYTNGTLTLQGAVPNMELIVNDTVQLLYPYAESYGLGNHASTLGGISYAIGSIYNSEVLLYYAGPLAVQGTGPMKYAYMKSNDSVLGSSSMTWSDPTPSVIEAIREVSFRSALAFSPDSSTQTIDGTQLRITTKYSLHYGFLGGTLAIIFLCVVSVIWLFYGFWLLGRPVSMSPLETATAFQAPLTAGADSNADAKTLASQLGRREVKYGAISLQNGDQTRAIAIPAALS